MAPIAVAARLAAMTSPAPSELSFDQASLPEHVEQTVQAIAKLHAQHDRRASPLVRAVDRMTALVARPAFIGAVTAAAVLWIGGNLCLGWLGHARLDQPPWPWLQTVSGLGAIYITALVLISQRRKDEISELREQLTLQLAVLTEQKASKLIALLEEQRRDSPELADRHDDEAEAMSTPADPQTVIQALHETHEGLLAEDESHAQES
jgi:uncharacterized membrane protein